MNLTKFRTPPSVRAGRRIWAFLAVFAGLQAGFTPPSFAMSQDVRTMLYASGYGLLGGTALGAASLPFHRSGKGVYLGSILGLSLGLIAGVYHVTHRDHPGNPLGALPAGGLPGERDPRSALLEIMGRDTWRGEGRFAVPAPEFSWSAAVFEFK